MSSSCWSKKGKHITKCWVARSWVSGLWIFPENILCSREGKELFAVHEWVFGWWFVVDEFRPGHRGFCESLKYLVVMYLVVILRLAFFAGRRPMDSSAAFVAPAGRMGPSLGVAGVRLRRLRMTASMPKPSTSISLDVKIPAQASVTVAAAGRPHRSRGRQ